MVIIDLNNQLFIVNYFIPGHLIDWQMIFYGTETPPQTTTLTPAPPAVRGTTPKTSDRWTDVKSIDRSKSSDFRDHMLDVHVSGCQRSSETCLGWCLVLVVLCTLYRSNTVSTNITESSAITSS